MFAVALAASMFPMSSAAQAPDGTWPRNCGVSHHGTFEFIFGLARPDSGDDSFYALTVLDADGDVQLDTLRVLSGAGSDNCVEIISLRTIYDSDSQTDIMLGGPRPEDRLLTITFEERDGPLPGAEVLYSKTFSYDQCPPEDAVGPTSFHCSAAEDVSLITHSRISDFADYYFMYDGADLYTVSVSFDEHLGPGKAFKGYEDVFGSDDWVMPYSLPEFCDRVDFECNPATLASLNSFLSNQSGDPVTGAPATPVLRDWTMNSGAVTLNPRRSAQRSPQRWLWNLTGQSVFFPPGSRLVVQKETRIEGMTLRPTPPALGWGGVQVEGATNQYGETVLGALTLGTGTIVAGTAAPHGAVRAEGGGTVTLDGAEIEFNAAGPGVVASGAFPKPARVMITGDSKINNHAFAAGVLAENGGFAEILGDRLTSMTTLVAWRPGPAVRVSS